MRKNWPVDWSWVVSWALLMTDELNLKTKTNDSVTMQVYENWEEKNLLPAARDYFYFLFLFFFIAKLITLAYWVFYSIVCCGQFHCSQQCMCYVFFLFVLMSTFSLILYHRFCIYNLKMCVQCLSLRWQTRWDVFFSKWAKSLKKLLFLIVLNTF